MPDINLSYIGLAAVVLILMSLIIYSTRGKFHLKHMSEAEMEKRNCRVRTHKGGVALDPNILEIHMKIARDNLRNFTESFTTEEINADQINRLKNKLKDARAATSSYIYLNLYSDDVTRDEVDNFVKCEKNKLNKCPSEPVRNMLRENPFIQNADAELETGLTGLVGDIDTIIDIIRDARIKRGELDVRYISELEYQLAMLKQNNMHHLQTQQMEASLQNKEGFLMDDLFYEFPNYWHWYDIAGTESNGGCPSDKATDKATNKALHKGKAVNKASTAHRLEGDQKNPSADVVNATAQAKEPFDMPKNKSHHKIKMSSSAHGINSNDFVSQYIDSEFSSNKLYGMRAISISDRKPHLNGSSRNLSDMDNKRSSLMG